MGIKIGRARGMALTAAAAAVAIACAASAAEPATEVIVEAPKVSRTGDRAPPLGAPIDLASIRYRVSYGDLNLATAAGAQTLEQRIHDAAKRACKQLDASMPPDSVPIAGEPSCLKTAVDGAMNQAREAIARARAPAAK